jgi:hypothetical protein
MFAPSGDGGIGIDRDTGANSLSTPAYFGYAAASHDLHHSQQQRKCGKETNFRDGIWALASPGVSVFGMLDIVVNDVQAVHALIRPAFHFFKQPDKRPTCLPREANAFVVFSFSQNSSGHLSATLMRVFQSESSSCRANATMTPMM